MAAIERRVVILIVVGFLSELCNSIHIIQDVYPPEFENYESDEKTQSIEETPLISDKLNDLDEDYAVDLTSQLFKENSENEQKTRKRRIREVDYRASQNLYPHLPSNPYQQQPAQYYDNPHNPQGNPYNTQWQQLQNNTQPSNPNNPYTPNYPSYNNNRPSSGQNFSHYNPGNPYSQYNPSQTKNPSYNATRPTFNPTYNPSPRPAYYPSAPNFNNFNSSYPSYSQSNNSRLNYPSYNPSQRPGYYPSNNTYSPIPGQHPYQQSQTTPSSYPTYNPSLRPPTIQQFLLAMIPLSPQGHNNSRPFNPTFNPSPRPGYHQPGQYSPQNSSTYPSKNYNNTRPFNPTYNPSPRPGYQQPNQYPYQNSSNYLSNPSSYNNSQPYNPAQRPYYQPNPNNNFNPNYPSYNPNQTPQNGGSNPPNGYPNSFLPNNPNNNNFQPYNPGNNYRPDPYNPSAPKYVPSSPTDQYFHYPGGVNQTTPNHDPTKVAPHNFSY